ncbi:MAG TPA: GPR endopeptidase, partial [Clostridia bacterium]|nr:GPR endopeptidase [Clostridia bacterium]
MIRTDLALETRELKGAGEITGVQSEEQKLDDITVTRVKILNEQGAQELGKAIGTYITIDSPGIADRDAQTAQKTARVIADELKRLIGDMS